MSAAGVVAEPERRSDVCEPTLLHLPGIEPPSSQRQHRPWPFGPYKMRVRTCEVCGVLYRPTYGDQRTCSRQCGVFLRWMAAGKPLSMPRLHGQHTDLNACAHCGRPIRPSLKYCPTCSHDGARAGTWIDGEKVCSDCGTPIDVYRGCGNLCSVCASDRRRERERTYRRESGMGNHRKRARHFNVPCEPVVKRRVFERDSYVCQDCGRKTSTRGGWLSPRYPTLDHIVPLSRGGAHVYANCRCVCRQCNIDKGNGASVRGDQLLLIG